LVEVRIYRFLEKLAWKKIDFPIFNSELSLERAQSHNLIKNKKTFIVHPPVDVKRFKNIKTKKGDFFLYVSRFNFNKRQDLLIDAWEKFSIKNPKYKLMLVGNIENKKYFKKILRKSEKIRNIEIKTNVSDDELSELYANSLGVFFIPFLEDFGIIPFEVLACGKPLLAVDKGGYVKLIEKSPNYFKIKEKFSNELMIEEINKTLEKFLKEKKIFKKNQMKQVSLDNLVKKLEAIFKNNINYKKTQ
jgi:glycosyltransferase involved in cell wall biosynthesis